MRARGRDTQVLGKPATGEDSLPQAALSTWLGLTAAAFGAASMTPPSSREDAASSDPGDAGATVGANWASGFDSFFTRWIAAFDNLQGSPWAFFWAPSENPMARLMSHPAAAVGGEHSPGRLSAHAAAAMLEFWQAIAAHQALQAQGWAKALLRFGADFEPARSGIDDPVVVETFDDLIGHWGVVGEAALQEHMRSEPFLRSQAEVLRRAMRYCPAPLNRCINRVCPDVSCSVRARRGGQ